ncbi:MAG: hypothetical protein MJ197_08920 [Bacteroidales bacterium]|nr:hypothetical protein [Bacteroidales bacterium]
MYIKRFLSFAFAIGFLFSCAPQEGKGGLASIQGKVMMQNLNAISEKSGEAYPATDCNVFISYGSTGISDDKEATGYDGTYQFSNLTKGDYTVFVYSDDSVSNSKYPKIVLSQKVSLDSKKDEAKVPTFMVYKHVDYDNGGGVVKGSVVEHRYSGSIELYQKPAQDADVYLQFANDSEILDRTRVDGEGNFTIRNLIPGDYRLYVYSENQVAGADSVCYRSFTIKENTSVVTVEKIDVKNY